MEDLLRICILGVGGFSPSKGQTVSLNGRAPSPKPSQEHWASATDKQAARTRWQGRPRRLKSRSRELHRTPWRNGENGTRAPAPCRPATSFPAGKCWSLGRQPRCDRVTIVAGQQRRTGVGADAGRSSRRRRSALRRRAAHLLHPRRPNRTGDVALGGRLSGDRGVGWLSMPG